MKRKLFSALTDFYQCNYIWRRSLSKHFFFPIGKIFRLVICRHIPPSVPGFFIITESPMLALPGSFSYSSEITTRMSVRNTGAVFFFLILVNPRAGLRCRPSTTCKNDTANARAKLFSHQMTSATDQQSGLSFPFNTCSCLSFLLFLPFSLYTASIQTGEGLDKWDPSCAGNRTQYL